MGGNSLNSLAEVRALLEAARTVAVLGAHLRPEKAACYVPDYLHSQGYRILPVNPVFAGKPSPWGEVFRGSLAGLQEPVDIVDVFRRSEAVAEHLDDLLAMNPLPRTVWFQQGIRNDAVAQRLREAGIDVVQDRCTLADHRALRIPARV